VNKQPLYKDIRLYTFLGIIAFLFVHHFYGYFGHYGFDDIMGYGYYAKKWADGELFFLNEDFFSYRWGFISLTGFFYALFGMSDNTSAIAPSLVLLGTVLLIYRVLRKEKRIVGVVAVLIYALDNWTMYYSDKLMPDTSVALATFAAFTIIYNFRFEQNGGGAAKHALLLSSVLIWAYITKQSVLLLFPVFFALLLIDVFNKRYIKFWLYTAVACIFMGLFYLFGIYLLTGDPLARFHAVEAGLVDNLGEGRSFSFCNYAIQPWSALIYRIGYEMIYLSMATGLMLCLMLALPAILSHRIKDLITSKTASSYWALVLMLSVLSSNFMTTSYKAYLPICPDIRHFLFLVPIAAVVAAPALVAFAEERKHKFAYIIVSGVVFGLAKWSAIGNLQWVFGAVFILAVLRSVLSENTFFSKSFLVGIFLAALAPVLSSMKTASGNGYVEQREVIYEYLKNKPHQSIVITNVIQKHFGQYLMEFDETALTKFYDYTALRELDLTNNGTVYVLGNGTTRYMSNFDYNNLPRCIKDCYQGHKPTTIEVVYESDNVVLYKLNDPLLLNID
jgi:hypothetical protein